MMPLNRVAFGAAHQFRVTFDNPAAQPPATSPVPDAQPPKPKRQVMSFEAVTRMILDKMVFTMPFYQQPRVTVDVTYPDSARLYNDQTLPPSSELVVRILTDTPPEKLKDDRRLLDRVMGILFRDNRLGNLERERRLDSAMTTALGHVPSPSSSDLFARTMINAARPTDMVMTADEAGIKTTLVDA